MSKFIDLPTSQKIQSIKDAFVSILEQLVDDPNLLTNYVDASVKPEQAKAIMNLVSSFKRKEGCICGYCLDVSTHNGSIPNELNPLIEAARKEAEAKSY